MPADTPTNRHTDTHTDTLTYRQTDTPTNIHTDTHTDRYRDTDRHKAIHTYYFFILGCIVPKG